MATCLERSMAHLRQLEGSIPWMYVDGSGRVKVGVGMVLPEADAAASLPFQVEGRAATGAEIAAEYDRLRALPSGQGAEFYRNDGSLRLEESVIDERLRQTLTGFDADLGARVPGYDAMPEGPKLALLDMIFDLGPYGLFRGYPHMLKAVEAGAWAIAAAASPRRTASIARNQWTRTMLLSAVIVPPRARVDSRWERVMRAWQTLRK